MTGAPDMRSPAPVLANGKDRAEVSGSPRERQGQAMNAPRKPRRPSETPKQLAPPHSGSPLAKAWTKGWHRGEDYHSDLSEELRDELREDKDLRAKLKAEIEEDLNGE